MLLAIFLFNDSIFVLDVVISSLEYVKPVLL